MGNIVFGGCSYTWGQSVWYHANFENDYHPKDGWFYGNLVCPECKEYMEEHRFAGQVSKYFGKEQRVKAKNGGSNMQALEFCRQAIDTETELVIIQTTQFSRDHIEIDEQVENFEKFVEETEAKGIPVRFLHWIWPNFTSEELKLIKNNKFNSNKLTSNIIKDRTIWLDGEFNFWKWTELPEAKLNSTKERYEEIKKRSIIGHFGLPTNAKAPDSHFSLYGHNIVAESIINYIKENNLLK